MHDEKKLGLEPVSAEELDDFYGCNGHGRNCPTAGKKDYWNGDCCWHDCGSPGELATKMWTAWA